MVARWIIITNTPRERERDIREMEEKSGRGGKKKRGGGGGRVAYPLANHHRTGAIRERNNMPRMNCLANRVASQSDEIEEKLAPNKISPPRDPLTRS